MRGEGKERALHGRTPTRLADTGPTSPPGGEALAERHQRMLQRCQYPSAISFFRQQTALEAAVDFHPIIVRQQQKLAFRFGGQQRIPPELESKLDGRR